MHAELQVMDLEHSNEAAIASREPHYRRWLASHGVPADRLQEAGERVMLGVDLSARRRTRPLDTAQGLPRRRA